MTEDKNPYGYDGVNEVSKGGRYLSFGKNDKGRVIQIRLASKPRYVLQHWIDQADGSRKPVNCGGENCSYCGKSVPPKEKLDKVAKWGWVVIDRDDGLVKLFTGPTLIARRIKEISELADKRTGKIIWGDPLTYDIQIERTEEPGKAYYKVEPMPEGKGQEITEEEKKVVKEADFNLEEELTGSKESQHTGSYGASDMEATPKEKDEDVVNPDDIPF